MPVHRPVVVHTGRSKGALVSRLRHRGPVTSGLDACPLYDPTRLPRILTRTQARSLGFTDGMIRHRVERERWHRILPRTFHTGDTVTYLDRQWAALAFAGDGAMLSGAAALSELGLRSIQRPESLLVLVPITTRLVSTAFVRIRPTKRLPERDLRPGPACAPVARAAADLALECRRLDDVRALIAEVVRKELCSIDELSADLESGPRNGSAHLRDAIEEIGGGAWSAPEARAARLMRTAGITGFQPNATIRLPEGRKVIVDFLWQGLHAVLEIDSAEHHESPPDDDYTSDRHLLLETAGYSVVHRKPRMIAKRPREFTDGIAAWLAARAAQLGVAA
jgi:very-short-patch-repair endonuclease